MKIKVTSVLSALAGIIAGAGAVKYKEKIKVNKLKEMSNKHLSLFLMMNQWVEVKQEGKNLSKYFEDKGYKNIAIYGMSYAGQTLVKEIKGTGITVSYGIDKNAGSIRYGDVNILSMDDDWEAVDAIVVTAITFYGEIEKELSRRIDCPIISLEDILWDI